MNEQQVHMSAGHPGLSRARSECERAYREQPKPCKGGLDTGARGWRFALRERGTAAHSD